MSSNPCTELLINKAVDHYTHLLSQGKKPSEALDHATQRFGVTRGAILRVNRSRHEFTLPTDLNHIVADYDAIEASIGDVLASQLRDGRYFITDAVSGRTSFR